MRAYTTVVLAALLVTGPASADDTVSKADREHAIALFDEGQRAYEQADFEAALAKFMEAYQIWPSPVLLFNIAQTYRLRGECDKALFSYQKFLVKKPDAPNRADVEVRITAMEMCVVAKSSEAVTVEQTAPAHPRRDAARDQLLSLTQIRVPREPNPLGLWIGGVGVAAASGTALYFHLVARNDQNEIDRRTTASCTVDACLKYLADHRDNARVARNVSLAVAGGMIVIGTVVYLVGKPGTIKRESSGPGLAVSGRGGLVTWSGAF